MGGSGGRERERFIKHMFIHITFYKDGTGFHTWLSNSLVRNNLFRIGSKFQKLFLGSIKRLNPLVTRDVLMHLKHCVFCGFNRTHSALLGSGSATATVSRQRHLTDDGAAGKSCVRARGCVPLL